MEMKVKNILFTAGILAIVVLIVWLLLPGMPSGAVRV